MCEWPMLNDYFPTVKFLRKEPKMFSPQHQQTAAAAGHRAPAEDNYFSPQKPFDFYFSLHHLHHPTPQSLQPDLSFTSLVPGNNPPSPLLYSLPVLAGV